MSKRKTELNEVDRKIIEYLNQGLNQNEIAKIIGVSRQRVLQKIHKIQELGVEIPGYKKIKKDKQDNLILEGIAEGKTYEEIGKKVGLSKSFIAARIKSMREKGIEVPIKSDEIYNKILEMLVAGKTQAEIGRKLGFSQPKISNKIKKMKERGIDAPTWSETIDKKIISGQVQGKKKFEIAEELNMSQYTVKNRIRKMKRIKQDSTKKGQIAKMIVNLMDSKNATIEQVRIMGKYYGVDVEEALRLRLSNNNKDVSDDREL